MRNKKIILVFWMFLWSITFSYGFSWNENKPEPVNPKIEQLLTHLKTSPEGPARIQLLLQLVAEYLGMEDEQALRYAQEGVTLCQKWNDKNNQATFLHNIGMFHFLRANYKTALEFYFQSLTLRREYGDKKGISYSYNNIGLSYFSLGDLNQALDYYFKSLKIKEELGDKKTTISTYNNIGVIYFKQGHYRLALDYYFKTLKLSEELGDKKKMRSAYSNIGNIYESLDQLPQAKEHYLRSLNIAIELGDKRGTSSSYENVGSIHQKMGEFDQAFEYYSKSLDIRKQLGDKSGISRNYLSIGTLYLEQKKVNLALELLLKSLVISQEIQYKDGIAQGYLALGKCYKEKGDYKKATDQLNRAYSLANQLNNSTIVRDTANELSLVYALENQFKQAYHYMVVFKEKSDSQKIEENLKKIIRLQMQYDFDKKQKLQELEQQKKDMQKSEELKRQRFHVYVLSGFAIFIALVFLTLFRIKVKSNQRLQKEIKTRKQTEMELLKSRKLETVGILSAGIAHDFNNLLAIIGGNLSMAQECLADSPPNPGPFVENAQKATNQAAELIKHFLTLSDGGWAQKKMMQLTDIVNATLATPEIIDIPIIISLPSDLHPLFGDERQLHQVLFELLINAHEATIDVKHAKTIKLFAKNVFLPRDNTYALNEGEYVNISIQDNGRGIPPELLEKVFDPYFSTKTRGTQKGMGLSLAVCYSIVQRHNGHLFLTSESEVGTTVHVLLPVVETSVMEKES